MSGMTVKISRLRVDTMLTSVPFRNPVVLAHSLATVDVIFNGRLMLGPGIGESGVEGR
jgi:alkanesulfonate monooxygenase SsuD/methylene tetrahydromethanopterin reductase-like flavin-dependent oxidoreductase (luciferase family)